MKHLKAFEFYFYEQEEEMDDKGEIMPPFGEEEVTEEEEEIMPTSFGEEEIYPGEEPLDQRQSHISKFDSFGDQSTCSSCNCKACECGGGESTVPPTEEEEYLYAWDDMEPEEEEVSVHRIKSFEAKSSKESSYDKSGLKNPDKADRNKDKKISGWEKKVGKEIQKSMDKRKESKPEPKDAQKESEKKSEKGSDKDLKKK